MTRTYYCRKVIQRTLLNRLFLLFVFLAFIPLVSSAHFIVGVVNNARDGTSANGKTVILWNPSVGLQDNLTDTIGPTGNSGVNNIYFFDCELLNASCDVGTNLSARVINNGDNYISYAANLTVTGAGFDIMGNLTLNSPPTISNFSADDAFSTPPREIDLTAAGNTTVSCTGIVTDLDGDATLSNGSSEFFDLTNSFFGDSDDNNDHYTNGSCSLDSAFGNENQSLASCTYSVRYFANSGNWNCTLRVYDNQSISGFRSNTTTINTLLAFSLPDLIDYGTVSAGNVSDERIVNITNVGNARVNLSLSGYGRYVGDGNAMNCSLGGTRNISISYEKYNLTASNAGGLNLAQFESRYVNLTSNAITRRFNLNWRQNDASSGVDDYNATYWRIYVPAGVAGSCTGNVVFGATIGAGS